MIYLNSTVNLFLINLTKGTNIFNIEHMLVNDVDIQTITLENGLNSALSKLADF